MFLTMDALSAPYSSRYSLLSTCDCEKIRWKQKIVPNVMNLNVCCGGGSSKRTTRGSKNVPHFAMKDRIQEDDFAWFVMRGSISL